ncbi:hypothetical protein PHYBLDRAFT_176237 [Phycomyces blakesleeanus NRRL 1555(-)]|uniref:Uncharacterized protein n=1 Tax=Phycomyces blakesleeanus (strain ATCC 8743b / DSM 1359 / FGSC 10004 / NBRC 33097 / NRRL 1555) TaxID=763407 RepID=A0A162Z9X9_PHYB8|nr:hypothetical protein PHYBLDRAFT_176237 [Phycomyces blakesleeanus NRRL 1555(-)]OAD65321.1 hypothetical protein PHYBLDRAFT_176237 [Phycomyces blakesleeanus NRRL 1555(-)]|eukprot:XP_018283361.1 hypothetical protein PHYBLDRAFT_176237 [Phycomyces blakesleeanus NRRL 1555(-)]
MATLNSVGACRSGFSLLLSSQLYKTFVCPKFEYDLAISILLKQDIKVLESIQDKCLCMIVGGHAMFSTIVLKHICNLPTCCPVLGVDPILFLSASRVERGRLIRWRMGWLPGKPKECSYRSDHTSCCHSLYCPLVPSALFEQLPQPDHVQIPRIDFAITSLPLSSQELRPVYWIPLMTILWHTDVICNPDGDYSYETEHGTLWI